MKNLTYYGECFNCHRKRVKIFYYSKAHAHCSACQSMRVYITDAEYIDDSRSIKNDSNKNE